MKSNCILTLLALTTVIQAVNVSGTVVDARSGESIVGVNVFIPESGFGDATDLDGFFILRDVPAGKLTLRFSHIAYEERDTLIQIENQNFYLGEIQLSPVSLEGAPVEVTVQRNTIIDEDLDVASFQVNPEILSAVPPLHKDVFQIIQFSPSVTISDPLSPQYYVRGSDPSENLVQLDGMTIYNPQHFMSSNAIFNPYSIKNVEMLTGGFDAEFGGRNASILNITTREGHHHELHGEFKPSLSGLTGAVEFPLNDRTTTMVSGRALTDLLMRIIVGSPNLMTDFNATVRTTWGKTSVRWSGFLARDFMDYRFDRLALFFPEIMFDQFQIGFRTQTSNLALGVQTQTLVRPNLIWKNHLYQSRSDVSNATRFGYMVDDTTSALDVVLDYHSRYRSWIRENTFKSQLEWFAFRRQVLKLGMEWNALGLKNGSGFQPGSLSPVQRLYIAAGFLQDQWEGKHWQFRIGARFSRDDQRRQWNLEPRATVTLTTGASVWKLASGRYVQYLTTIDSKNDEFIQFLDYYTTLRRQEPMQSIQTIVSWERPLTPQSQLSVTAFYKELTRTYRSTFTAPAGVDSQSFRLEAGSGEAYGIEALWKGSFRGWSGWLSYGWSRGYRRYASVMQGKRILYDGDQPHHLKAVIWLKLTPEITVSNTFQYSSGFPRTWETGQLTQYYYDPYANTVGVYVMPITPVRNNVRFPPQMRWDVGWKKKLRSGFGFELAQYLGGLDADYELTIRNLLFLHRDPSYYFYLPRYGYYAYDLEWLPSVNATYTIKF
ncbi:MAG: TonB-dependent receptor [Candidatus Neomarinimicrobiota bacterium]|nr:MAG: TonB-dependent receptor [Candidatus Neomarinimicrobiota bacterium]